MMRQLERFKYSYCSSRMLTVHGVGWKGVNVNLSDLDQKLRTLA